MLSRPSKLWLLLLTPLAALAVIGGGYWYFYGFYGTGYQPPPTIPLALPEIVIPFADVSGFEFDEAPTRREGVLVVDVAHSNNFDERELDPLLSRVSDRGYTIEFLGEKDHGDSPSPPPAVRLLMLEEKLRQADSFAIILPQDAYTQEEVNVIEQFVRNGGKVLLTADPTRHHHSNSVAEEFGIVFQDGFLYNVAEHELNYRNIFLRDFVADELTEGLTQITFYTAGSIKSGVPLVSADSNTYSSMIERTAPFTPVVKSDDGSLLAIFDFTFMIPPRNAVTDNARFIANIAGYLTSGDRSFHLTDFPHSFRGPVDILIGQSSLFSTGTRMKTILADFEIPSEVRGVEDFLSDTVFLGLYEDSADVAQYLEVAGIQVGDTVRTPFSPAIPKPSTGILLLHQGHEGRQVLTVLGDTESSLQSMVELLQTGRFRSGLVSDLIGVFQFQ